MSSPHPQLHLSRFSIAWIAASLSAAVVASRGRPARLGSYTWSDCWTPSDCRTVGLTDRKTVPRAPRNSRRLDMVPSDDFRFQLHSIPGLARSLERQRRATRPQHDQTAEHQHEAAEPHPPHQWVDRESEYRLLGSVHQSGEDDVEVDAQAAHDSHFGRGLEGGTAHRVHVLALFRPHAADRLPVALDI